jgi:hypothetical protein
MLFIMSFLPPFAPRTTARVWRVGHRLMIYSSGGRLSIGTCRPASAATAAADFAVASASSRSARAAKAAIELQELAWGGAGSLGRGDTGHHPPSPRGGIARGGPTNMRQFVHYLILGGFVFGTGVILALALHVVP